MDRLFEEDVTDSTELLRRLDALSAKLKEHFLEVKAAGEVYWIEKQ